MSPEDARIAATQVFLDGYTIDTYIYVEYDVLYFMRMGDGDRLDALAIARIVFEHESDPDGNYVLNVLESAHLTGEYLSRGMLWERRREDWMKER